MPGKRLSLHRDRAGLADAYHSGSRAEKTRLLDRLERETGYHRKYLLRLLAMREEPPARPRKPRPPTYSEQAMDVAHAIWEMEGRPSSERLAEGMPSYLERAGRHIPGCTEVVKEELLRISVRQLARRLRARRQASAVPGAAPGRRPGDRIAAGMGAACDKEIDVVGLACPLPVLRTKKALADISPGQTLRVRASDPGSMEDIPGFVRQAGHELLGAEQERPDLFVFTLRKR